jgi:hypothetical protein
VDKSGYHVLFSGDRRLHDERVWYATADDRVIGAVVRDRIDDDYGWIMLESDEDGTYLAVDVATSKPTQDAATTELHAAMRMHHAGTYPQRVNFLRALDLLVSGRYPHH